MHMNVLKDRDAGKKLWRKQFCEVISLGMS